jgi:hypothetical protein
VYEIDFASVSTVVFHRCNIIDHKWKSKWFWYLLSIYLPVSIRSSIYIWTAAIYRQQKVLCCCCWIDCLLMIKNCLIESGPPCIYICQCLIYMCILYMFVILYDWYLYQAIPYLFISVYAFVRTIYFASFLPIHWMSLCCSSVVMGSTVFLAVSPLFRVCMTSDGQPLKPLKNALSNGEWKWTLTLHCARVVSDLMGNRMTITHLSLKFV